MKLSRQKRRLIEKMQVIFERVQAKSATKEYSKFFVSIKKDIMKMVDDGTVLSRTAIKKIVNKYSIDVKFVTNNINLIQLQNEITNALVDGVITAKTANNMIEHVRKTGSTNIAHLAVVNPAFMKKFWRNNLKYTRRVAVKSHANFKKVNIKIKSNMSRRIFKKYKAISNRARSFDDLKNELRATFAKDPTIVDRILRTEIHSQNEQVKLVLSSLEGYKYKTWITELDSSVRDTHRRLHNKRIPIAQKFKVGSSRGDYPGDLTLSPGERINCRCTLIYSK